MTMESSMTHVMENMAGTSSSHGDWGTAKIFEQTMGDYPLVN